MWILMLVLSGTVLSGAHILNVYSTEQECKEMRQVVEDGMKAAYPEDSGYVLKCVEQDVKQEKGEPIEEKGVDT